MERFRRPTAVRVSIVTGVCQSDIAHTEGVIRAHNASAIANLVQSFYADQGRYSGWMRRGELIPHIDCAVRASETVWQMGDHATDQVDLLKRIMDGLVVGLVRIISLFCRTL